MSQERLQATLKRSQDEGYTGSLHPEETALLRLNYSELVCLLPLLPHFAGTIPNLVSALHSISRVFRQLGTNVGLVSVELSQKEAWAFQEAVVALALAEPQFTDPALAIAAEIAQAFSAREQHVAALAASSYSG